MRGDHETSGSSEFPSRVALVTGASSGIGRAIARRLAEEGLRVATVARRGAALEALARETGDRVWPVVCDLGDPDAIGPMFDQVRTWGGGVDLLVNAAGTAFGASLITGSVDEWQAMWRVNVLAVAEVTRLAVADMRERDVDGHILHIGSMSGHRVTAGSGMYAATKHAVRAMTEGLRLELRSLGSGIRVGEISPGVVNTRFGLADGEAPHDRGYALLEAEDVAETVVHVLKMPPHVQITDVLMRPTRQPT